MVKVGALIQVRLGSERLPGKALLPLPFAGSVSLLEHVVQRAQAATSLQQVIVATTDNSIDDAMATFCATQNLLCFRGSADDVLDRYLQAARKHQLEVIVRLTGDNPFVMPETIDQAVAQLISSHSDYLITEGLPLGTNVEVFTIAALEKTAATATEATDREHVTSYIRRSEGFQTQTLTYTSPISNLRLTVDFPSDYALACLIHEKLASVAGLFTHEAIADLLLRYPWLQEINAMHVQRKAFASEEEELLEARKMLQTGGFARALQFLK